MTSIDYKNDHQWRGSVEMGHDCFNTYKDHCLLGIKGVVVLILVLTHELLEDEAVRHSRV